MAMTLTLELVAVATTRSHNPTTMHSWMSWRLVIVS